MSALCRSYPALFANLVPQHLLDDLSFMKMNNSCDVFERASKRLMNNTEFLQFVFSTRHLGDAAEHGGRRLAAKSMLQHVSPELQDNEQVVCWAVWSLGVEELRYASDAIQDNEKVIKYACSIDYTALLYASDRLKQDTYLRGMCLAAVPANRICQFRFVLGIRPQKTFSNLRHANNSKPSAPIV
jgi:hypothetical protein